MSKWEPKWICEDCLNDIKNDLSIKTIPNNGQVPCYFCDEIGEYLVDLDIKRKNEVEKMEKRVTEWLCDECHDGLEGNHGIKMIPNLCKVPCFICGKLAKCLTRFDLGDIKTDKLKKLLERCKCGVYLSVNEHRDYYQTAADRLKELYEQREEPPEINEDVRVKMIETDTIVELQFYPDTPIRSYTIWHYDLDEALAVALECLGLKDSER